MRNGCLQFFVPQVCNVAYLVEEYNIKNTYRKTSKYILWYIFNS